MSGASVHHSVTRSRPKLSKTFRVHAWLTQQSDGQQKTAFQSYCFDVYVYNVPGLHPRTSPPPPCGCEGLLECGCLTIGRMLPFSQGLGLLECCRGTLMTQHLTRNRQRCHNKERGEVVNGGGSKRPPSVHLAGPWCGSTPMQNKYIHGRGRRPSVQAVFGLLRRQLHNVPQSAGISCFVFLLSLAFQLLLGHVWVRMASFPA